MAYRQIWVKEEGEVCGGCRHVKGPGWWAFEALNEAADRGLIPLLRAADALARQSFYCTKEKCRVHLIDRACSLWEPPERRVDPLIMSRFQELCRRDGLDLMEALERLMGLALKAGSVAEVLGLRK